MKIFKFFSALPQKIVTLYSPNFIYTMDIYPPSKSAHQLLTPLIPKKLFKILRGLVEYFTHFRQGFQTFQCLSSTNSHPILPKFYIHNGHLPPFKVSSSTFNPP